MEKLNKIYVKNMEKGVQVELEFGVKASVNCHFNTSWYLLDSVSLVFYNVICFRILIGGSYEFYSTWMAQIPIRLGGLGLRCQADLAQIAYTSALEKSLPYFGGENGICQPLAHLGGADEEGVDTRWRQLVLQGSQLSVRPVLRSLGWRSEGWS